MTSTRLWRVVNTQILKQNKSVSRVRIEGHVHGDGLGGGRLEMSADRAQAVKTALIARGVEPDRLQPKGFGGTRPVAQGNDKAALEKNRRVEVMIVQMA